MRAFDQDTTSTDLKTVLILSNSNVYFYKCIYNTKHNTPILPSFFLKYKIFIIVSFTVYFKFLLFGISFGISIISVSVICELSKQNKNLTQLQQKYPYTN